MGDEQGVLFGEPTKTWPDWFTIGTSAPLAFSQRVARGRHPLGAELGPEDKKCRHCVNAVKMRKWWKCRLVRVSSSPGSDLRLKWRACQFFRDESAS